ncbi:MAG: hypothetical protein GY768_16260 [Planctomycetaceae bacterium]|nr:hypothetical protein [Planctomycetaceae bacterium]
MSDQTNKINPFPGLRTFQSEEDYLFFGREEQVAELLTLLRKHRFLAVVGSSGSGKSSLVRCGLLSQLQGGMMLDAGAAWQIAVMQPGGDPLLNLAQSLIDADLYDGENEDALHQVMATVNRSTNGLVEAIRQSELEPGSNVLLVVDQFEEVFRFHEAGNKGRELAPDFIRWLIHAVNQNEIPIYVVLTMRSDFLGDCARFTGLAEAINHGEYLVPKLTRDQVQQAIEGPVRVAGGQVSRRLIQRLLNDVGEHADQLPVLQHSLMRSWDRCCERAHDSQPVMDLDDYQSMGGMVDALSNHADEILFEIQEQQQDPDAALLATERLFRALTEKGADNRGIRRPTRLGALRDITGTSDELLLAIIDAYRAPGRTFLMPTLDTDLTDRDVIDISHESLMRVWKRLRAWVEEESQSVRIYKRLSETALLWKQDEAGLYRDPDLQIALSWLDTAKPNDAWAARYDSNFSVAVKFLEDSKRDQYAAARLAEENRQRELSQAKELAESQERLAKEQAASAAKFKKQSRVIGVVALVAIVASVIASVAMYRARENERVAKQATKVALESKQALTASYRKESLEAAEEAFAADELLQSLQLLQVAYNRDPQDADLLRQGMKYLSRSNLFGPYQPLNGQQAVNQCFALPEIDAIALVTADGKLKLLPAGAQGRSADQVGDWANAEFSIDGMGEVEEIEVDSATVQLVDRNGTVWLIRRDEKTVTKLASMFSDQSKVPQPQSKEGVSLAAGRILLGEGSRAVVVDSHGEPRIVAEIELENDATISHACLAADGKVVFLVTTSNEYHLYDVEDASAPLRRLSGDSDVLFVTYLPLQRQFLTIERDGLLCLTSVDGVEFDNVHLFSSDGIKKVVVSPEGTRLASLDRSGQLVFFSLIDGRSIELKQLNPELRLDDFIFDPLGVVVIGTNLERKPLVIRAEDGQAVISPYPLAVKAGSLSGIWKAAEEPGNSDQKQLHVYFVQNHPETEKAEAGSLEVRLTAAYSTELLPDLQALDFALLDAQAGEWFFSYFTSLLSASPVPDEAAPIPSLQQFLDWYEHRSVRLTRTGLNDDSGNVSGDSSQYLQDQLATDANVDLVQAILIQQLTPEVLVQAMRVPREDRTALIVGRYHQIKFLQESYGFAQNEDFALGMLEQLVQVPMLLESRSQSFVDQSHEGTEINLTSAEWSGEWDGLSHCWKVEPPQISLHEERRWAATNNQYITWMGAAFADFRLKAKIVSITGNSGIDARTQPAEDISNVFDAAYMHPYLRQGYQADLTGFNNFNRSNFHGKFINDNYARPTVIADRGESVVVRLNNLPLKLARSQSISSVEILRKIEGATAGTSIELEMRGNHFRYSYGEQLLNEIFDGQSGRDMSGEFAIQALGADTYLVFEDFLVKPLGRDLAEAEIAATKNLQVPIQLLAELAYARKRWYELLPLLESVSDQDWVARIRREVNLSRRYTHRQLAKAAVNNNVDLLTKVIDEINDPRLLNEIAHSDVGDVGYGSQWGTPLMGAAVHGSVDAIRLLAANGVDVSRRKGIFQLDALKGACFGNQPETVKLLLKLGVNPDEPNVSGFCSAHEVGKWAGPEVAQLILASGANFKARNNRGYDALQELADIRGTARQFGVNDFSRFAVSDRRLKVAALLVNAGMDPNAKNGDQGSAIEIAEMREDNELADLLRKMAE